MPPPLFFLGMLGLIANIVAFLAVLVYTDQPPPHWFAYPVPLLLICVVIGLGQFVLSAISEFKR